MADGSSSCKQLTRLLDIASIVKYQHYFVLPPGVPALRIVLKGEWLIQEGGAYPPAVECDR